MEQKGSCPPDLLRQKLVDIYTKYNVANVPKVDYLLEKYKDQEQFLYKSVCEKYGLPLEPLFPPGGDSVKEPVVITIEEDDYDPFGEDPEEEVKEAVNHDELEKIDMTLLGTHNSDLFMFPEPLASA
eukprot:GEMP01037182.1.p2 GENE.GEMP01037182.1~~GEMP01037182.1.p2  ORF type:complete len:127 (+),score=37.74 GEMP01037182.1:161-541(+)